MLNSMQLKLSCVFRTTMQSYSRIPPLDSRCYQKIHFLTPLNNTTCKRNYSAIDHIWFPILCRDAPWCIPVRDLECMIVGGCSMEHSYIDNQTLIICNSLNSYWGLPLVRNISVLLSQFNIPNSTLYKTSGGHGFTWMFALNCKSVSSGEVL